MACFIVPATEAVVTSIAAKKIKKNEASSVKKEGTIALSEKMGWLNKMLWGGSGLLAFEHLWHGEITPWFPFLTNAANRADAMEMLKEMGTSGVAMAAIVTAVWGVMAVVSSKITAKEKEADGTAQ